MTAPTPKPDSSPTDKKYGDDALALDSLLSTALTERERNPVEARSAYDALMTLIVTKYYESSINWLRRTGAHTGTIRAAFHDTIADLMERISDGTLELPTTVLKYLLARTKWDILDAKRHPRAHAKSNMERITKIMAVIKDETMQGPPTQTMSREQIDQLSKAINSLNETEKTIVALKSKGLTLPQVADKLGRNFEAVKKIYLRAKTKILANLAKTSPTAAHTLKERGGNQGRPKKTLSKEVFRAAVENLHKEYRDVAKAIWIDGKTFEDEYSRIGYEATEARLKLAYKRLFRDHGIAIEAHMGGNVPSF